MENLNGADVEGTVRNDSKPAVDGEFKPPPPPPPHKRPYSNWFMFNSLMTTSPFILLPGYYFMSDMFVRTSAVDL